MSTIHLVPGAKYFAGFSKPWFVPESAIRSHLEGLGATNIVFHSRDEVPPVSPSTDPTATDQWDQWVSADYPGPAKTITEKRRWAWAVRRVVGLTPTPETPNPQLFTRAVEPARFPWGLAAAAGAAALLIAANRRR